MEAVMTDAAKPPRKGRQATPDELLRPAKTEKKPDVELKDEELRRVGGGFKINLEAK
jgi:hypothetical protein